MIFISFSSSDIRSAEKLNHFLTSQGLKTWFAPANVKVSSNYANDISSAIKDATSIVLLFSKNSNDSAHVQKEIDLAISYKKKIYPLRIENILPTEGMEYLLSGIQWRDAHENFDQALENFVNELRSDLGLQDDITKNLNENSIKDFAMQHFKEMNYKIMPNSEANWKEHLNSHECLDEAVHYLKENAFCASKANTDLIVVAKYLENSTIPNFKIREADYFWKTRNIIWKQSALKQVCQELQIDVKDDDIDFKIKSKIADRLRSSSTGNTNITILFYLFIQNPPAFKKQHYLIPLQNIWEYEDGEKMPQLYLNYTFKPNWWGYGKNDLEQIPGKRYVGFADAYKKVQYKPLKKSRAEYEHYDGRIAETLAEVFLKRNDLVVQKFGAESVLGNSLSFMQRSNALEDAQAADTIIRFMTSPDLLVIKLDEQANIKNSYFMDVKYRSVNTKNDFIKRLNENEEIYNQAKKYQQNWDKVYLFLFLEIKESKSIEIYILPVQDILDGNYKPYKIEEDFRFGWLDNQEIKMLYKNAKGFWL